MNNNFSDGTWLLAFCALYLVAGTVIAAVISAFISEGQNSAYQDRSPEFNKGAGADEPEQPGADEFIREAFRG